MRLVLWLYPEIRESFAARMRAESEVRELRTRLADLQRETITAKSEALDATQRIADFLSQAMFGRKIFAANPDLPEERPEPLEPARRQARAVQEEEWINARPGLAEFLAAQEKRN